MSAKSINIFLISFFLCIKLNASQKINSDSLLKIATNQNESTTNRALAYIDLSNHFTFTNIEKANAYAKKAIELSEKTNDKTLLAEAYTSMGTCYSFKTIVDTAKLFYDKALLIFQEKKYNSGLAKVHLLIGENYETTANWQKSIEHFLISAEYCLKDNNKKGLSKVYNKIGQVQLSLNHFEEALSYSHKGLKLSEEIHDKYESAKHYNLLGIIHDYKTQYDSSIYYYNKALVINRELGATYDEAIILMNQGVIYLNQNKLTEAKNVTLSALELMTQLKEMGSVAICYVNLAEIFSGEKKYNEAIEYIDIGIKTLKELNRYNFLMEAYRIKSNINMEKNDFENAYISYVAYSNIKDSLYNSETNNNINELQTKFKTKEQEAEIKLQKAEAAKQKTIFYFMFGAIILILIIAVISIIAFKNKQKANLIIEAQKKEVEHQKEIIEEKQKEIVDSINYAKRIQYTLLAHDEFLQQNIPDHFVYFNPKDIVSGDFYWATKFDNKFYIAVCDSTGHGVPGAFMSLLNIGFLSEAINEKNILAPNEILNYVRKRLTESISRDGQKDGFDGILLCIEHIDDNHQTITYAAANNAPILIQENELMELPYDRMPFGVGERQESFKLHSINTKQGDLIYLYTDGYADQFGGPKGKKFKYKSLNELILKHSTVSLSKQKEELKKEFDAWRGNLEQVDDVCIIGIKLT